MQLATNEILHDIDVRAEEMKFKIRSSKSDYPTNGSVYYFSGNGDDANDGLSADSPKKTLLAASELELKEGDTVLFKRGDVFRGKLKAQGGVTYSAFGDEQNADGNYAAKPVISGSPENCARPECWKLLDGTENIWFYYQPILDVGGIVFDYGKTAGIKMVPWYNKGHYRIAGTDEIFDESKHITDNLGFFSRIDNKSPCNVPDINKETGRLYLRCDEGNPGEVFESIELLTRFNNIGVAGDNVTIDNICVMHCGCHGIGTGNRAGLTVRNCELGWIGGCVQFYNKSGSVTRYGNGVEIYVGCKDFTVENCYIYQIYDAGVTHQYKGTTGNNEIPVTMENVLYKDNLFEHCIYSIEYFLEQDNNEKQIMKNVLMTGNICRYSGYGWGSFPDRAAHIKGWDHRNISENFVIENNIFDRSRSMILHCGVQDEEHLPVMRGNTYIHIANNPKFTLGRFCSRGGASFGYFPERTAYDDAEVFNAEKLHDDGAKFYYVTEEPVFDGKWPSGEK